MKLIETDVFIAGSGPIGSAFAREILDSTNHTKVWMAEIGAQNDPVIGAHHKNSVKYQKDIDAFVHVIQGALQHVSVPPASTNIPTLGTVAVTHVPGPQPPFACSWNNDQVNPNDWPNPQECSWPQWPKGQPAISNFFNPNQIPEQNLPGCAITRTVGGMATHWTCACPRPHPEEYKQSPLGTEEFERLIAAAEKLLNVHDNQYDHSIRHNLVKRVLTHYHGKRVRNLPLGVERNRENPELVTWTGTNTVLGDWSKPDKCCTNSKCSCTNCRFSLRAEHKVIKLNREEDDNGDPTGAIESVLIHDLRNHEKYKVRAKRFVIACGAVCTPQILWNSGFGEQVRKPGDLRPNELPALGRYLSEQSLSFCQIVLKRQYVQNPSSPIETLALESEHIVHMERDIKKHQTQFSRDPIPIPFIDPEPQVNLKYTSEKPWHAQIHRDAFSYGDVGPRADPRLIVDLRFFGKQDISVCNRVKFENDYTDIYGLPQPTFEVYRSEKDAERDHRMMLDMCEVANELGAYLPGSYPQFMQPGLALHITGTTRLGRDPRTSVANEFSQVHGHPNLYVGGNNVIPDSTACNPTLTSLAYALKAARQIAEYCKEQPKEKQA